MGQVTKWLSLDFNARFYTFRYRNANFRKNSDRFFAETTKLYPMMPLYDNNGHYTRNLNCAINFRETFKQQ